MSDRLRDHIPDNVRRAAKSIGLAVFVGDPDAWTKLPAILAARLDVPSCKALALAALSSLSEDDAEHVIAFAIHQHREAA